MTRILASSLIPHLSQTASPTAKDDWVNPTEVIFASFFFFYRVSNFNTMKILGDLALNLLQAHEGSGMALTVKRLVSLLPHKSEDVPLVEFMYLVFTRMPDESYHRQLRSLLLYLCYTF